LKRINRRSVALRFSLSIEKSGTLKNTKEKKSYAKTSCPSVCLYFFESNSNLKSLKFNFLAADED
jgi:hypothetical protein